MLRLALPLTSAASPRICRSPALVLALKFAAWPSPLRLRLWPSKLTLLPLPATRGVRLPSMPLAEAGGTGMAIGTRPVVAVGRAASWKWLASLRITP